MKNMRHSGRMCITILPRDFLFFQADIQGNELLRQRVSAVSSLLSGAESR